MDGVDYRRGPWTWLKHLEGVYGGGQQHIWTDRTNARHSKQILHRNKMVTWGRDGSKRNVCLRRNAVRSHRISTMLRKTLLLEDLEEQRWEKKRCF